MQNKISWTPFIVSTIFFTPSLNAVKMVIRNEVAQGNKKKKGKTKRLDKLTLHNHELITQAGISPLRGCSFPQKLSQTARRRRKRKKKKVTLLHPSVPKGKALQLPIFLFQFPLK